MAHDLVPQIPGMEESLTKLAAWAAEKAGWAVGKGGEIVSTVLFKSWVDDLRERIYKGQQEGVIKEDFERSRHGQSLLTEALNALWQARDQERAEAIQRVFLGLAMNPVEDSLAQIQQLHVLRLVSDMTTWEVALCNALERYSTIKFDPEWQARYDNADSDVKGQVAEAACKLRPEFSDWLKTDFAGKDEAIHSFLITAYRSMHSMSLLRVPVEDRSKVTGWSVCQKRGAFTEFGWKLAQHLYSAELPTKVEAK